MAIGSTGWAAAPPRSCLIIKDLLDRQVVIRSLREGVDSSTRTGQAVLGIMASLADVELVLGRLRREAAKAARKARNLPIGRPRALSLDQIARAERMRAAGEPVREIAKTLDVSRSTMYRLLAATDSVRRPRSSRSRFCRS